MLHTHFDTTTTGPPWTAPWTPVFAVPGFPSTNPGLKWMDCSLDLPLVSNCLVDTTLD